MRNILGHINIGIHFDLIKKLCSGCGVVVVVETAWSGQLWKKNVLLMGHVTSMTQVYVYLYVRRLFVIVVVLNEDPAGVNSL